MSLLNLFGCMGTVADSFVVVDTDPEVKRNLDKIKKYKFLEISEQLMALPITSPTSQPINNIFAEFASEVISSDGDDDNVEIFVGLIILNAFEQLKIDASTENLDYYKEFLVRWFISVVTDDDLEDGELKTISDVYNRMTIFMTRLMIEIVNTDDNDLFVCQPQKREKIAELFELYCNIVAEQNSKTIDNLSTKLSQVAIDTKKEEALKLVTKASEENHEKLII